MIRGSKKHNTRRTEQIFFSSPGHDNCNTCAPINVHIHAALIMHLHIHIYNPSIQVFSQSTPNLFYKCSCSKSTNTQRRACMSITLISFLPSSAKKRLHLCSAIESYITYTNKTTYLQKSRSKSKSTSDHLYALYNQILLAFLFHAISPTLCDRIFTHFKSEYVSKICIQQYLLSEFRLQREQIEFSNHDSVLKYQVRMLYRRATKHRPLYTNNIR